jgi:L-malate glycosyltransferase
MKLLVISHACIVPVNQQFYAELERETGWEITIIMPSQWASEYGGQLQPKRWPSFRGEIIDLPIFKSGSVPLHGYRSLLIPTLKRINPDAIYVHQEPYSIVAFQVYLANYLSIKKPISFFTWQNLAKSYPLPFRQMESWVLNQTHVMFSGSHGAEAVFRNKGFLGPSVILPAGVDTEFYHPGAPTSALQDQLRDQPGQVLLGFLGRIVEEKGLKTLLHGLKLIQDLPWKLVLVGNGAYENEVNKIARQLDLADRVQCLGYVPHEQAPQYLAAFDILMLPSETRPNWKEQFGRVIIEALACGTPVLGSDSGEIPHLIQATGGGMIFAEGQPEALANQLRPLIMEPAIRDHLSTQGRNAVLKHYTNTTLTRRFAEAIEQATAGVHS